ncbi:MAG: transcriptional regulator [Nocardioides sp.]|nr:transcriptional regulator [Nocardioides sp.]
MLLVPEPSDPARRHPVLALPPDAGTLAEGVATAVRDGVRAGELVPGEVYSVYQLAGLLGVSRSPVREALLRLAEAGLVRIARNRGFEVLLPRADDVADILDVRLSLEPLAAARAASRAGDDERAAVGAAQRDLERAAYDGDEAAFWQRDRALHDILLRAGGNARVARVVADLRATTALLGPPTTASGRTLAEIAAEHRPVVDAIVGGDPAAAERAMRTHLEHTRDALVARLGSTGH